LKGRRKNRECQFLDNNLELGNLKQTIKYTCSNCGKVHEEWPALAYISPTNYEVLSEMDKQSKADLSSDLCSIRYSEETNNFIRATLSLKVIDHCEDLEYGLWVSLSDKSFKDYKDNFSNENYETKYFGWLSNDLPDYVFNESIPTTVFTRTGNKRPEIIPHQDYKHPFVDDYYNGITKAEAERRIEAMLNIVASREIQKKKPWWKLW
jgi:hypothetical protein